MCFTKCSVHRVCVCVRVIFHWIHIFFTMFLCVCVHMCVYSDCPGFSRVLEINIAWGGGGVGMYIFPTYSQSIHYKLGLKKNEMNIGNLDFCLVAYRSVRGLSRCWYYSLKHQWMKGQSQWRGTYLSVEAAYYNIQSFLNVPCPFCTLSLYIP